MREEFEKEGRKLPPKQESQTFDSNVVTPGTEFMAVLSVSLQYYVHQRLNYDPGWKDIMVILTMKVSRSFKLLRKYQIYMRSGLTCENFEGYSFRFKRSG